MTPSGADLAGAQIVGSLLLHADRFIATLVAAQIPHMAGKEFGPCKALGVVRRNRLVGGVVYHNYRGHDIEVSTAFDDPSWCLPGTLRGLFAYPFGPPPECLGCIRLTAVTGRRNKPTRRLLEGLGFKLEGVHPKGLDGREDAMSYGMLRDDCRWLRKGA